MPRPLTPHPSRNDNENLIELLRDIMASVFRPAAVSCQTCSLWSSRTALLQQASRARIPETLRTSYLLRESRCLSTTQRKSPSRMPLNEPISAPFHTSARRQILPPGPRKCLHHCPQYMPLLNIVQRSLKVVVMIAWPELLRSTVRLSSCSVNDPAPVPTPSPTHGSYHWVFER